MSRRVFGDRQRQRQRQREREREIGRGGEYEDKRGRMCVMRRGMTELVIPSMHVKTVYVYYLCELCVYESG